MAFIGNTNITQGFIPAIDYFSGDGSTVAFTLSRPVASVAQVQANISNVPQNPSSAFSVSGNTITFTSAPPSGTNNIYVYYTSPITQVIAPSQGTVNTTSLGNITNIASGNSSLTLQTGSTPTTALTIDTSQNVAIGATSPKKRLTVSDASSSSTTPGTNPIMWVGGGNVTVNTLSEIGFTYGSNTTWAESNPSATVGFQLTSTAGYGKGALTFCTRDVTTDTAPTERMRIDSSGNLLVGTTSTLGASGVLQLLGSMDAQTVARCSAASAGQYWRYGPDSGNNFLVYSSSGTGGVYIGNSATSWSARSDERVKDIIEPINDAVNKVCTLRAVIGKYKEDDEGTRRSFLIAQDVQKVLPEAVNVQPGEQGILGVQYTDVIPLLVAAIKEQQALIQTLTDRITALENK
jgi:hypothetical protein